MATHIRSHRAARALTRHVDRHRHLLASGLVSIVLALQPMTSLELRRFAASRTELSVHTTSVEMTVHLCIARAGCGALTAQVLPR
jgi:hypothetical protein